MNFQQATIEIREAVSYAKERGWRVINKTSFARGHLVKGERVCKVCPLMALVLMHSSASVQKAQLGKDSVPPASLARRAGKILGVPPICMEQFMSNFDNEPEDEKGWPKGLKEETIRLAEMFGDLGVALRKELKPRPA